MLNMAVDFRSCGVSRDPYFPQESSAFRSNQQGAKTTLPINIALFFKKLKEEYS